MYEDEIDKEDIRPTGVSFRVPHEGCVVDATFTIELDWNTLWNVYFLRPARVDGAVTQLLPPDLPEYLRIAFRCDKCWGYYSKPEHAQFYARDKQSMSTAHLDVYPATARELLKIGIRKGFTQAQGRR